MMTPAVWRRRGLAVLLFLASELLLLEGHQRDPLRPGQQSLDAAEPAAPEGLGPSAGDSAWGAEGGGSAPAGASPGASLPSVAGGSFLESRVFLALYSALEPHLSRRSDVTALAIIAMIFVMVGASFVYLVSAQNDLKRAPLVRPPPGASPMQSAAASWSSQIPIWRLPLPGSVSTFGQLARNDISPASTLPGDDRKSLPQIYPPLVIPTVHTRLIIPTTDLSEPSFEIDVLGASGRALLYVKLEANAGGARSMEIGLHSVKTLVAVVTSSLQVLTSEGKLFGTLERQGISQYCFCDSSGRDRASLVPGDSAEEIRMMSTPSTRAASQCAAICHQCEPSPHYELVVNPGVDAVFVLASFLGLIVFALPQHA